MLIGYQCCALQNNFRVLRWIFSRLRPWIRFSPICSDFLWRQNRKINKDQPKIRACGKMNSEDFMVQDVKHSLDHGEVKLMYWRDGKYRTVKWSKIEKPKNRVRNFRVKLHSVFGRLSTLSRSDRLHKLPSLPPAVISRSSKHVQRFPSFLQVEIV